MRLLIVEDERGKENNITNFIKDTFSDAVVEVRHSVTTGIIAIRQLEFDYVLLDMSLPLFDFDDMKYSEGNEFETFGGNSVLDEIDRLEKNCKVIVVTAFDVLGEGDRQIALSQIESQLNTLYPDNFIGTVFYKSSKIEWKKKLEQYLERGE